MVALSSFPLPQGGRGQGEGACNARTSAAPAMPSMQFSSRVLNHCALRHPLTPALSPGRGEGVGRNDG
jgi:hypothetical protein